jgi:O-antigen/teichoic acid export membrane protein
MKTTSLFGGVQVFNILITMVRTKLIAVLIGPAGMGIAGLLLSTTNLITAGTNFGLNTSAVRHVAAAHAGGDSKRVSEVVGVLRRLVWFTGLLGAVLTFFLAPLLSRTTFGNSDFTGAFRWISITLLFSQLAAGRLVLLQGMRQLRKLAMANLLGSSAGLLVSVPVYYYMGIDGVVPTLVISSVASMAIAWFLSAKIPIEPVRITSALLREEGMGMLRMGFTISLSGLLGLATAYLLSIFIGRTGGVEQVGFYNSGFSIINTYVTMIFGAMATDYFPRLSTVATDNGKSALLINQQAELAVLIMAPLLILFIIFIKPIVLVMYTGKFLAMLTMMRLFALGIFFKAVTWAMGFLILARGDARLFFISELAASIYVLLLNMVFYYYYGLTGLGFSFIFSYALGLLQTYLIIRFKYRFAFSGELIRLFCILTALAFVSFLVMYRLQGPIRYALVLAVMLVAAAYSLKGLNTRIHIADLVAQKFKINLPWFRKR